ncbi:Polyketide cyclase / dehydrase and lipid transport [Roseovarius lutimaris]|uniref:Polyketide cyclase / dehydrase and lipid transport n=1 Tax=Roseovarius lutimaris TaxID=1005928 RepID=A0A1I5CXB0_9RHOB|nr:SRPBCC family protein [Roseovarius lutimaris]SFN91579.1 Polyketide cyclase / dehydrase and lipid transport [Roseovarius lutimaris]
MQFSTREDIEAPIETVFAEITDFQAFERSALRRGAEVRRIDDLSTPGVGMAWHVGFMMRGKRREIQMQLSEYDPPNGITLSSMSPAMGGAMMIDLVALSRGRTRMSVDLTLKPKNLASRLLVQTLKLARSNLTKRFKLRAAEYAMDVEDRYKRSV